MGSNIPLVNARAAAEGPWELPSAVILSHELRSLLAAMTLALSDLDRRLQNECRTEQVIDDIAILDTAARRATELTTWVLSAAGQPVVPNPRKLRIDVALILNEVAWDLRPFVAPHDIMVTSPTHLFLTADSVPVRAILTNLVLNAARRTVNGSAIDVDARRVVGGVEVSVSASAWQPTQEELSELFRPFNTRESRVDVGTVDLRVAQDHAAVFGGIVHPVTRADGGTAVTLLLPVNT
jgi:K+-sensing histidine kinase KdpD